MLQRQSVLETPRVRELKRQRKTSKKRKILLWTIGVLLFLSLLIFLSHIKQMRINTILISGNTVVKTDQILAKSQESLFGNYLYAFSKQNFLLYPRRAIERNLLSSLKRLQTVQVTLQDVHTLRIVVSEREGRYLWCGHSFDETVGDTPDAECYYLDAAGYIFSKSPYFSGNVYLKFFGTGLFSETLDPVGRQYLPIEEFTSVRDFSDGLAKLGIDIYAVYIRGNGDYDLYISSLEPGRPVYTKIRFNKKGDSATLLKNLRAALETEPFKSDFKAKFNDLMYIDLRFTNKVLYMFKPTTVEF